MSEAREKARALLANATPGPWRVGYCDEGVWKGKVWCNTGNAHPFDERVLLNMNINGDEFPVTADAALIAAAPGLLAALCDENDALEQERGLAIGQRHAAQANLAERDAQLSRQNAGLVHMARDRDAALAERDALRAELAQEAALRAELAAEVKRLRALKASELERRAILDAMNGGES